MGYRIQEVTVQDLPEWGQVGVTAGIVLAVVRLLIPLLNLEINPKGALDSERRARERAESRLYEALGIAEDATAVAEASTEVVKRSPRERGPRR